jgi:hypothetical protein
VAAPVVLLAVVALVIHKGALTMLTPIGPRHTGIANFPLYSSKAPRWFLTVRSNSPEKLLSVIVSDFGPEEMLKRLSHPYWFQAFGCVLSFDWHSSGVTTTMPTAITGLRRLELE